MWLLGPEIDILPSILLPLAGPEEFSESENDSLPPELQYLDASKQRESSEVVRGMLLKSIVQVCRNIFYIIFIWTLD